MAKHIEQQNIIEIQYACLDMAINATENTTLKNSVGNILGMSKLITVMVLPYKENIIYGMGTSSLLRNFLYPT